MNAIKRLVWEFLSVWLAMAFSAMCVSGVRADIIPTIQHEDVFTSHIVNALVTAEINYVSTVTASIPITLQPDTPRALRVTMTDANGSVAKGFKVVVTGKNQYGNLVTETFTRTTTGTASTTGSIAFATITSIVYSNASGYGSSVDSVKVMLSDKFGLVSSFTNATDVFKIVKTPTFGTPANQTIVATNVNPAWGTVMIPSPSACRYDFWIRAPNNKPQPGRNPNNVNF